MRNLKTLKGALCLFSLTLFMPASGFSDDSGGLNLRPLESMAIQSGGRMKPLSSFAREVVVFVTSKEKMAGKNAVSLLIDWLAYPDHWEIQPLLPVSNKELREFLGMQGEKRISPKTLSSNLSFIERAEKAEAREEAGETLTFVEKKQSDISISCI